MHLSSPPCQPSKTKPKALPSPLTGSRRLPPPLSICHRRGRPRLQAGPATGHAGRGAGQCGHHPDSPGRLACISAAAAAAAQPASHGQPPAAGHCPDWAGDAGSTDDQRADQPPHTKPRCGAGNMWSVGLAEVPMQGRRSLQGSSLAAQQANQPAWPWIVWRFFTVCLPRLHYPSRPQLVPVHWLTRAGGQRASDLCACCPHPQHQPGGHQGTGCGMEAHGRAGMMGSCLPV